MTIASRMTAPNRQVRKENSRPPPATSTPKPRNRNPPQKPADDTDHDVEDKSHLPVGFHDLAADPAGQTADDDPADDTESEHFSVLSTATTAVALIRTGTPANSGW